MDKFLNFAAGRNYKTATYLMVNLTKRRYVILSEDPQASTPKSIYITSVLASIVYLSTKASLRELIFQLNVAGFEQVDTREENENAE